MAGITIFVLHAVGSKQNSDVLVEHTVSIRSFGESATIRREVHELCLDHPLSQIGWSKVKVNAFTILKMPSRTKPVCRIEIILGICAFIPILQTCFCLLE